MAEILLTKRNPPPTRIESPFSSASDSELLPPAPEIIRIPPTPAKDASISGTILLSVQPKLYRFW